MQKRTRPVGQVLCHLTVYFFLVACVPAQGQLRVEHDLMIPNARTPWAIDVFENRPQLVPIHHSMVIVDKHRGANIAGSLAGSFLYRPKLTTELNGKNSRTQLHTRTPVFYLLKESDVDPVDSDKDAETYTFAIIRVSTVKDKRVIDMLSFNSITANAQRRVQSVQTTTTKTPDGWIRIEPNSPMDEGEYCILPIPKTSGTYSTEVFDFGINLGAANVKDAVAAPGP